MRPVASNGFSFSLRRSGIFCSSGFSILTKLSTSAWRDDIAFGLCLSMFHVDRNQETTATKWKVVHKHGTWMLGAGFECCFSCCSNLEFK